MTQPYPFNLDCFRALLESALERGYRFRSFRAPEPTTEGPVCLLRFDIDTYPAGALTLARIASELGVQATFFVMLRSPLYNAFSRDSHTVLSQVLELGHWLGLHYDGGHAGDGRPISDQIQTEARVLSELLSSPVDAVSFHQPSPEILRQNLSFSGLANTYSQADLPGFVYLSDSNRTWRSGPPDEAFARPEARLQLLLHPIWWTNQDAEEEPEAAWERVILANWDRTQAQLLKCERAYGPPRRVTLVRDS